MPPFDHATLLENILAGCYLLLAIGVPTSLLVRSIGALLSHSLRRSLTQHPIIHCVWLILSVVLICDFASVFLVKSH